METAEKIIGNSSVWTIPDKPEHTDFPAVAELYREYTSGIYPPPVMLCAAVALGKAIGIRNERARRRREQVSPAPEAETKAAYMAMKQAKARLYMERRAGFSWRDYKLDLIVESLGKLPLEMLEVVYSFVSA